MSDERRRELERASAHDPAAAAAALRERLRLGTLTRERLALAAWCGHEPAIACGEKRPKTPRTQDAWLAGLRKHGLAVLVRASLAVGNEVLASIQRKREHARLGRALDRLDEWLRCPCVLHMMEVWKTTEHATDDLVIAVEEVATSLAVPGHIEIALEDHVRGALQRAVHRASKTMADELRPAIEKALIEWALGPEPLLPERVWTWEDEATIDFYSTKGEHGGFSNFSKHGFSLDGREWPTVEHWFQAQKFLGTPRLDEVRDAKGPAEARKMGRSRHHTVRPDWENVRVEVMRRGVHAKLDAHPELAQLLIETGKHELVEASPTDIFWGCGRDRDGLNMLGQILMEERADLTSRSRSKR